MAFGQKKRESVSSDSISFVSEEASVELLSSPRLPSRMSHYSDDTDDDEDRTEFIFLSKKARLYENKQLRRASCPQNTSAAGRRWLDNSVPFTPPSTPLCDRPGVPRGVVGLPSVGLRPLLQNQKTNVETPPSTGQKLRTGLQGLRQNAKQTYEQELGFGTSGRKSRSYGAGIFGLSISSRARLEDATDDGQYRRTTTSPAFKTPCKERKLSRSEKSRRRVSNSQCEADSENEADDVTSASSGPIAASKVVTLPSINSNSFLEQPLLGTIPDDLPDIFLTERKRGRLKKKRKNEEANTPKKLKQKSEEFRSHPSDILR